MFKTRCACLRPASLSDKFAASMGLGASGGYDQGNIQTTIRRNRMSSRIEGVPDGWELVRIDKAKKHEFYLDGCGERNGKPGLVDRGDIHG